MDKRTFLKLSGMAGAGLVVAPWLGCQPSGDDKTLRSGEKPDSGAGDVWGAEAFALPALSFGMDALEPAIDAETMAIHHGKHHAGYVRKLNAAIEGRAKGIDDNLITLLKGVDSADEALRNNGGGHFNHTLYWEVLTPGGPSEPQGALAAHIVSDLGGIDALKAAFAKAGSQQFGSGWAWLSLDDAGQLFVSSTPNQDNPLMTQCVERSGTPILGMDVWEHAYYLNYQNSRTDYIQAFLGLVNWESVALRFQGAMGQVG
ncbi:MAG: superoxide dismutase [Bacteroidetes bacterium]|nr:superoxide dismutase [Bacteroidota bacterium]MDA0903749.1 superoxide dismutase [Bacteroidota bacterium]MDA1242431.1 superoxide dismutase [Bacteroidota bacterium]